MKNIEMYLGILWLIVFALFLSSAIRDIRRFRNSVYFLALLIVTAMYAIIHFQNTALGPWLIMLFSAAVIFLVLIVPILLIFNGFIMIRREGHSLSNLLSLLFGIFILGGEAVLLVSLLYHNFGTDNLTGKILLFMGYTVFYVSVVYLCFMFYTFFVSILPKRVDYDYVIILGAGLINGNQVSRLLGDRIDKAIKVYERSMSDCKIIVSGGQGADETVSEAEAMKQYLLDAGIDERDIIKEDKSTDTMENLVNSQAIIKKRGGRQYVAVTTSGYHVFRAMLYSSRISFPVTGIGAHTAFYYWPSAMIREYAAIVRYYWKPYFLLLFLSGGLVVALISVL